MIHDASHWPKFEPFRITNEEIEAERERFAKAMETENRSLWWWPPNEEPPREHWSRKEIHWCRCGKQAPDGPLALCGYCGGATKETPSLIPRR
jgi:hypothetical protein